MLRVRRRDHRRHLQAVPRQGDQGDPSPRARGRRSRRGSTRRAADRAPARARSSWSSTGRRRRSCRKGSPFTAAPGTRSSGRSSGCDVDPAEVFGTNCVKFAGADDDACHDWFARELRIVQPRLVVVMGDDALEFVNRVEFPLSQPLEATLGELQQFTPTIEALVVPDIDLSLDDQPSKTRFWNAFKSRRPLVGRAAALLIVSRALVAWFEVAPHLSSLSTWSSVAIVSLLLMPAMFSLAWLSLPVWRHPRQLAIGVASLPIATLLVSRCSTHRCSRTSPSSQRSRAWACCSCRRSRSCRGRCSSR